MTLVPTSGFWPRRSQQGAVRTDGFALVGRVGDGVSLAVTGLVVLPLLDLERRPLPTGG